MIAGCRVLQFTKKRAFHISAVVLVVVALYALAGFVLAPRMLRSALLRDIPKILGVTPSVGEIRLNPFLFRLEIKDFSLTAPSGEKLLGFGRLFVDFELSSIWHRAYSFANIDIDAPSVNAIVAPDGKLNLLQLSPKTPPAKTQEKKAPLPAIRIGSFKVSKGLVSVRRSQPPVRVRGPTGTDQFRAASISPPASTAAALPSRAPRSSVSGWSGTGTCRCSPSNRTASFRSMGCTRIRFGNISRIA